MGEKPYQVVFTGQFSEGLTRKDILDRLTRLLRKEPAELRALFHAPGAVIVARTSQAMAQKFVTSLNQTGALCEIREREAAEKPKSGEVATGPEPVSTSPDQAKSQPAVPPDEPPTEAASEAAPGSGPAIESAAAVPSPEPINRRRPRTLRPKSGPSDITLSPLLCANAAGHPGGLSTNRKDWAVVLFRDLKMLAAFKTTEAVDEIKLLLFPATSRRPLLIEANTIAFAQFPGVAAGKFLPTLRNFLIMIYRSNRDIILDQATAEFMKGSPPPQFAKDPVNLISDLHRAYIAASAQPLSPAPATE